MACEWPKKQLEEIAELSGGYAFKSEDYSANGRFILRTLNIKDDGSIHRENGVFISHDKCGLYERFELDEHDTLFVMVGATLGKVGFVRREILPALLNQNMWRIRARTDVCDKRYLQYAFRLTVSKSLGLASGSARDFVRRDDYRKLEIPTPPLPEQKRIAGILGALDDKIELNRKMNETLEQMARALFKSWFIDFEPVHSKASRRQPAGMDKETGELFPASFVDSDLGKIPKGWKAGSVYEISDLKYGAPFASALFNSTGTGKPLVRIRDLADESTGVYTTELHPKGYLLQPGDIAVGMDGEFRAYLWAGVESWLNQRICVFIPKDGFSPAFVRNSIMAPLSEVESTETATTVIHLGKNDIDRFKVIIPNREIANSFSRLCQPWYDRIVLNKQESRTLSAIRETLLPKLLNGEA